MYLSQLFLSTFKEAPIEAKIISHNLMIRSGMIHQTSSGIYAWLPLGLKVLKNIENIIREEQNKIGAQELILPTIQPLDLWIQSGREESYGKETLKMKDRHGRDMLYGPTAEEIVTSIAGKYIKTYKSLPYILYQIHWKFRDEIRPRFGVMRGREFLMKDAYSFDLSYEQAKKNYDLMFETYMKTFLRMGLKPIPVRASSGAIGGDLSHEFHILSTTGENKIYYNSELENFHLSDVKKIQQLIDLSAFTEDTYDSKSNSIPIDKLKLGKGIEVGQIFYLGTKYTKPLKVQISGVDDELFYPHMGCYGIGVSRLVGAIIEANHDDYGIKWPENIAPYKVGIINLKVNNNKCDSFCKKIYDDLNRNKISVLYDDTNKSPGNKFAQMDLIGLPWQIIIGPRDIENDVVEIKHRFSGEKQRVSSESAITFLNEKVKC